MIGKAKQDAADALRLKVGMDVIRQPVTFLHTDNEGLKSRRGKVVYIHPLGRYHMVEFQLAGGSCRECFWGVNA